MESFTRENEAALSFETYTETEFASLSTATAIVPEPDTAAEYISGTSPE